MLKNLIFLFGFSTFVTIVWIVSAVFHNSVTSKVSPANKDRVTPISSTFDIETINDLKTRENIRTDLSESTSIITNPDIIEASESSDIDIQTNISTESGIQEGL